MITDFFLDQKRVNGCEHTVKMAPHVVKESANRVDVRQEGGGVEGMEGKLNGKLKVSHFKNMKIGIQTG